ncbi:ABC transporter substrate-binding protein [Rivibacter subsaxonicus]|uniref:ABC-type oligopeptide transport system substrate-binding subunit n=1 Tax=Rivibacter subsaxonicus TaxID=457575 RepID=A0A4Q7VX17_9BURK|nr:ABC transporter substrate-binding protein [Rivibacter subsaxonicus]RZU01045.1 ABC-type oligopeptide transport system substrate-binding subunit [Rivibacter subsaxonicus]
MRLRFLLPLAAVLAIGSAAAQTTPAPPAQKVLRYAFRVAETGFDPAQISDLYSRTVAVNVFEAPYQYEFLARPARMRPNTAASMPEHADDYKTWTVRLKPGTYFADDPAFKGQRRELTAQDYVYSIKRFYDPRWKSPNLYLLENAKLLGLSEVRREVLKSKEPFPYDREVEGVRALDRYTLQFKLAEPRPRFAMLLSDGSFTGAVAREVVEAYGDKITEHPVGTGPFRLAEWRRASRIVLEKNSGFRDEFYDEDPPPGDPLAQAAQARFKGRKLPMIDRVEISIIEENQPRWLAFLNAEHDIIEQVPADFATIAMPNNQLAPNLKKQSITMVRYARADVSISYFNMEDPLVGGYSADKVALRRAISLAVDVDKEIRLARRGQATQSQGVIAPGTWGFDPAFRSEMSEYDPARAKALLDLYGYVDRDGDGWREQPDGKPLLIEYASQPDNQSRQLVELWKKNMDAIGIRMEFKIAKWPENLKASTAGKLMMWGVGWSANDPDGDTFLALGDGGAKGQANKSRFNLDAFNAAYRRQKALPNSPERQAAMDEASKLLIAYMPIKAHVHQVWTDLAHPWVLGYHRNIFVREFWKYVDVDPALQSKAVQ